MVFSSNELDMIILQNGEDGTSADSKYIWVKYSQNANGVPLTDDPTGAVYIGIAYNKDSIEESNNPDDYSWSKILGDKGEDAYTIILSNENISFSVSYEDNLAIGDQSFTTDVRVFYGATERDDFVIGEIGSSNGITVSKTVNSVTLSVTDSTKITAKHGYFRIPISIDGLIFYKDMSWNTVPQGVPGSVGQSALNISLGNESQNIPCNSEGVTLESFLIEIPFAAYEGFNKVACTASVGVLPSGITLGQNTGSTPDTDGLIILNVARGSNLGGDEVLQGKVVITFIIGESEVIKNFTWTKTKDGATGEAGQFTLYSLESSAPVISKTFEDTFSPESITFSAYSMEGNSGDKTEYSGMFIIEESTNGTTYDTSYLSSADEQSVTFTPTSINVISIRCTLYKAGGITSALDIYTVPVLTDVDNMRPIIDEITTSISGLESKVDSVEKTITDKVWQSDITTQINNYDNTTVKIIRDQVAETQTSLSEIRSTVSDVQTTLTTKADGSTVQTLSEKVSNIEQDAEGFKQTVEENYVTNDKLDENSKTLRSEFNQTASEINQTVTDLSGNVTAITQNVASINQKVTDAEGNISSLQQTSNSLQSQIETAQGDISNIHIGGRNLLLGTDEIKTTTYTGIDNDAGSELISYLFSEYGLEKLKENKTVTTSFDWEATGTLDGHFHIQTAYNNYNNLTDGYIYISEDNSSGHVSKTITIDVEIGFDRVRVIGAGSNSTLTIKNLKVEIGNKPTDWSPAPEDMATGKEVEINKTNIAQNAQQIELAVEKTQEVSDDLHNNYYNKTETEAKIKVASESITSTVKTTITEEIDKVDIGGRNLLLGTDEIKTTTYTGIDNDAGSELISYLFSEYGLEKLKENKTVTTSFDWEATGTLDGHFHIQTAYNNYNNLTDGYIYISEDNSSGHVSKTITIDVEIGFDRVRVIGAGSNSTLTIKNLKVEIGNKPTDWSPAPEDMATGKEVENAQASADHANSIANSTESRITVAESTIQQLSDSISSLVIDENGNSMMTQTSTGWQFNMGDISSQLSDAKNQLNNLSGKVDQANGLIQNVNDLANDLSEKTAYINMTTDFSGNPCIELGRSSSNFKVRITNTSIDFMEGSSRLAYFTNQSLYIGKAIIRDELQIGEGSGFVWKRRSNGNMGLRWVGGN